MTPRPDIEIAVRAAARKLEFRARPRMRTSGASGSKRKRLPDQVEPGRTYRDPAITGWLRARARIESRRRK